MKKRQGYKFRLEPKCKQIAELNLSLGANRFVWNKLLAMNLFRLKQGFSLLWYQEMAWHITLWKKTEEYGFLKEAPSQSLQQTARALDRAFKDAFDKSKPHKKMPVFKRLGRNEAGIKYPQGGIVDSKNKVIFFPKLGWIKYRKSRELKGNVKNITVLRQGTKYFVSLQTEEEVEIGSHSSKTSVGIDLGVVNFASLSNGEIVKPVNSFRKYEKFLSREQKKLKNKNKFSNNWKRQKTKISKMHRKIADLRLDFLHKTSTNISKNHAMIVLEDLKVANLSKSAKGSIEEPGNKVRAKSGLNKAILDQGWGEFRRQLKYKQAWRGGIVLEVNPKYTSQTCPSCLYIDKGNRQTQAEFCCLSCGYKDNADLVGAINILRAGHAQLACEVSV